MILFVHGADSFLVNARRTALQRAYLGKYPEAELFVFDFEEHGTADEVRRALGSCEEGLFVQQKMVVFRHPFELSEANEKHVIDFLERRSRNPADEMIFLFANPGKIPKASELGRFLLKQADKVEKLEKPDQIGLSAHIRRELSLIDSEASFSREALRLFSSLLGADTARIHSELMKLSTFKPGGVFETSDVELLISAVPDSALFEALDALGRGERKCAIALLHRESRRAEGAYPILAMCAWQTRRLLLVRGSFDGGARLVPDIARETKLPAFVVQRMLGTIDRFPPDRLKKGLSMLSDFDTAFKHGEMDPAIALDLFAWKF